MFYHLGSAFSFPRSRLEPFCSLSKNMMWQRYWLIQNGQKDERVFLTCVILMTYISLGVQLDEVLLPLEGELADLGPAEGVDLGEVLEDEHAAVGHGQVQGDALVVLEVTITKRSKDIR